MALWPRVKVVLKDMVDGGREAVCKGVSNGFGANDTSSFDK